jgi:ubiquinone/menaquinone biosynthesis C-methylase UbiE
MTKTDLSWSEYARKYDMLLAYNPFYQSLFKQVMTKTDHWNIEEGDVLIDIGAGTGNYSCALAEKFPQAHVIHIDSDAGMIRVAETKKQARKLENLEIRRTDINHLQMADHSLKAVLCIHSIYTLSNPSVTLKHIYNWLVPGGHGIIVDPGRKVNVLHWQWAIGSRLIRTYGMLKTLKILKAGKAVSKQNKAIRKLQDEGTYWTHTHEEFCTAIEEASFTILEHETTFRTISDLAVVTKNLTD